MGLCSGAYIVGSGEYEISGQLHQIQPARRLSGGKRLRSFVLRWPDGDNWSVAELTFKGDNVVTLDGYRVGESVVATFSVEGREWTNPRSGDTRVFTDLVCHGLARAK